MARDLPAAQNNTSEKKSDPDAAEQSNSPLAIRNPDRNRNNHSNIRCGSGIYGEIMPFPGPYSRREYIYNENKTDNDTMPHLRGAHLRIMDQVSDGFQVLDDKFNSSLLELLVEFQTNVSKLAKRCGKSAEETRSSLKDLAIRASIVDFISFDPESEIAIAHDARQSNGTSAAADEIGVPTKTKSLVVDREWSARRGKAEGLSPPQFIQHYYAAEIKENRLTRSLINKDAALARALGRWQDDNPEETLGFGFVTPAELRERDEREKYGEDVARLLATPRRSSRAHYHKKRLMTASDMDLVMD